MARGVGESRPPTAIGGGGLAEFHGVLLNGEPLITTCPECGEDHEPTTELGGVEIPYHDWYCVTCGRNGLSCECGGGDW